jgi:probable rRNA maturation factor
MNRESADLSVQVHFASGTALPWSEADVERALLAVLHAEGVAEASLSIAFVDDAEIAAMNEQYLGHAGPTDVISFPLNLPDGPTVGDVYVGVEQARRQAAELNVPFAEEVLRLAIHGTLHVLGYDHPEDADREASPMYQRQEHLLASVLGSTERR